MSAKSFFAKIGLAAAAMLILSWGGANADVTFRYVSAKDATKMALSLKPGETPPNLADGPTFKLSLRMRNKPGKVETHSQWNDEIIIQSGQVLLRYGGKSVNAKQTTAGETIGESMDGGQSVLMSPGDIVIIPAGMPHQMLIQTPVMTYILFKTKA